MIKNKYTLKNIKAYIQGNFRYRLYYSKYFSWLLPDYIKNQIDFRILIMDQRCYENGSCIECGCSTTALQMADKNCEGECYPPMLNKKDYINFMRGKSVKDNNGIYWRMITYNIAYDGKTHKKCILLYKDAKQIRKVQTDINKFMEIWTKYGVIPQ